MQAIFSFSFLFFQCFFRPSIDQNNILSKTANCTPREHPLTLPYQQAKQPQATRHHQSTDPASFQIDLQIPHTAVTASALDAPATGPQDFPQPVSAHTAITRRESTVKTFLNIKITPKKPLRFRKSILHTEIFKGLRPTLFEKRGIKIQYTVLLYNKAKNLAIEFRHFFGNLRRKK